MVCVNKERFTCICGCNMTTSTVIFGVIFIFGGFGSIGGMGGLGLMGYFQFIMGALMLSVLCYPKSIAVRRCIYKTYVAYCIVLLIVFIIVIILILAVDSLTEDATNNSYSSYNSYYGSYSSNYSGELN